MGCYDVDECFTGTHNCAASQTCINMIGAFVCSGSTGYGSRNCEGTESFSLQRFPPQNKALLVEHTIPAIQVLILVHPRPLRDHTLALHQAATLAAHHLLVPTLVVHPVARAIQEIISDIRCIMSCIS